MVKSDSPGLLHLGDQLGAALGVEAADPDALGDRVSEVEVAADLVHHQVLRHVEASVHQQPVLTTKGAGRDYRFLPRLDISPVDATFKRIIANANHMRQTASYREILLAGQVDAAHLSLGGEVHQGVWRVGAAARRGVVGGDRGVG